MKANIGLLIIVHGLSVWGFTNQAGALFIGIGISTLIFYSFIENTFK